MYTALIKTLSSVPSSVPKIGGKGKLHTYRIQLNTLSLRKTLKLGHISNKDPFFGAIDVSKIPKINTRQKNAIYTREQRVNIYQSRVPMKNGGVIGDVEPVLHPAVIFCQYLQVPGLLLFPRPRLGYRSTDTQITHHGD